MPYKLSPSVLKLFEECPRCFWLAMNKGKKRPETIFPSLPGGMDIILKKHFDSFMHQGKLPPELCEKGECKNLKLFDNEELLRKWRNAIRGIWYEDKDGNVLHGGVDNILVNKANNKLIVLDYKTRGFPLKEDTAELYRLQLDIYNYLLRKLGHETEDFGYLLFYYPKEVLETGEVVFETALVKMKTDVENAEKTWKKALKLLAGPCPKHTINAETEEACEWCRLLSEE